MAIKYLDAKRIRGTASDKTAVITSGVDGTWSAGGALASDVTEPASGGNSDDAIVMGGYAGSITGITTTQEYNGTAWSGGGNLQSGGGSTCGGGNSSDAIIMTGKSGGSNLSNFCQEYNGTSWSDGGNPNTNRHNGAGDGNSSDAICVGGSPSQSETYDGTSWTDISEVTGRENFAAGGSSTSAICMGATVTTETWDGTSWTAGGNMTQANGGNEGGGTPTNAITIGGTTDSDMTEKYNGTSWAAVDLLTTGRGNHAGKGNNLNAFCAGGGSTSTEERTSTPDVLPATYQSENTIYEETDTRSVYFLQSGEWVAAAYVGAYEAIVCGGALNESPYNTTIISSGAAGGAWTTAANMPDRIWNFGGGMGDAGRSTFMIFGGHNNTSGDGGELDDSYKFDGTTWGSNISMPYKHNGCTNGGGSSGGALTAGGRQGGQHNNSSKFNGSSWSSAGSMNIYVMNTGGDGTNSDFLRVGGRGSGNNQNPTYDQSSVESHNGSSWSSESAIGTAIAYHAYFGNSSDGINVGGAYNYTKTDDVSTYNGSSWSTSASDLPIATSFIAGGSNDTGASTKCMVWGGNASVSPTDKSYQWNGTSWTEKNALTYAAAGQAGGLKGL